MMTINFDWMDEKCTCGEWQGVTVDGCLYCDGAEKCQREVADLEKLIHQQPPSSAKVERGVMVMKDGKAWSMVDGGDHTRQGWGLKDLFDSPIYNPEFCKRPTDVTYKDSPYVKELKTGELVKVERITTVRILS